MKRLAVTLVFILAALSVSGDDIRGPVTARLNVEPSGVPASSSLGLEDIVLAGTSGDPRFFDAIELEITIPEVAVEFPGAFVLKILKAGTIAERSGVAEVNGPLLLSYPLVREGRASFQLLLRPDAEAQSGATTTIIEEPLAIDELPVAITLESRMKGLSPAAASIQVALELRPVSRRIGGLALRFVLNDGTLFQTDGFVTPEFELLIDGETRPIASDFLLQPGIHEISISSDVFQDQSVTIGVEQARFSTADIPLLPALASVSYTAPRDSRVYLDGRLLDAAAGAFTAPPGEHTIVVVVGDYTVTRRFSVEEGREYDLSVTMDVSIEEVN